MIQTKPELAFDARRAYAMEREEARVDPERLNALEQAIGQACLAFGFAIIAFRVVENRAGEHVPMISLEIEQRAAPDDTTAMAWFKAIGAKVVQVGEEA